MLKYCKSFLKNDDGVEMIEFVGLVVIAAALILIAASIGTRMTQSANTISNSIDKQLDNIEKNLK